MMFSKAVWASFSRILERKDRRTIGRNSDGDDGADFFLRGTNYAFFQVLGKTPVSNFEVEDVDESLSNNSLRYPILPP